MDDSINMHKKDLQVRQGINDILDRYNRLPFKYQSKVGYDSLI